MKFYQHAVTQMQELDAGCSAFTWATADGKHLWGRNFDFNRIAAPTQMTYVPRGTTYHLCVDEQNPQADSTYCSQARYAAMGTGFLLSPTAPILYEGINEQGLMGGQLYYRGFAHFKPHPRPGTKPLQPPFAVYHLLAQCANVQQVADMLHTEYSLIHLPLLGSVPTIHWAFTDRTGETIIIEPDKDGLHIYRHTVGVMTNSPSYSWHRTNLLNYAGIRDLDYDTLELDGDQLEQVFSGSGAQGLPGDWSSPSRFVRLAFLRHYAVKGENEEMGIAYLMHLMQSAAFPLGMVRVSQPGQATQQDTGVVPYDYTIYTSAMCAESLRFYWTTYENQRVQCVDLNHLMYRQEVVQFALERTPDFHHLTQSCDEGMFSR